MTTITTAAVLGAGTMGAQIAAHLANAGVPVLLLDVSAQAAREGFERACARLSPSRATSGVRSSSSAGTPAFAKCAAICAPIVPAPRIATDRMGPFALIAPARR